MEKRKDYINWDEYFMGVAMLSAKRSKDPSTQVGACIVNEDKRIVGIGYNGFPVGISDDEFPWDRQAESPLDTKYPYVVHAEANAILNSTQKLRGCTVYVTLFPCNECSKLLIQSGVKEVVYLDDFHATDITTLASKRMLKAAGISVKHYVGRTVSIND